MSYGEPVALPNYGRFFDLASEVGLLPCGNTADVLTLQFSSILDAFAGSVGAILGHAHGDNALSHIC